MEIINSHWTALGLNQSSESLVTNCLRHIRAHGNIRSEKWYKGKNWKCIILSVYRTHFFSHTIHNVIKGKFSKNPKLFIRLQINKTILRELYASVKKWALAQIIICYVFQLTTVQHTRTRNCPVSYHRTSNNNIKLSPQCWSSNNSVVKLPRLWVNSSGLLLPAGSRHVLFHRTSAADLASYSMGSCPEGKVTLYVFMACTGQLYPCHCTSQYQYSYDCERNVQVHVHSLWKWFESSLHIFNDDS